MIKSEVGMLCGTFLIAGFLLGNGEWRTILAGVLVGFMGIFKFNKIFGSLSK